MEIRVPGADMNPYFALSAIFLLGFRGIEKQMSIPVPPVKDLMNDKSRVTKLATNLETATSLFMREGSVAREVFGNEFVDHFGGTREHEVNAWNAAVTNWEVERYLELV
ncbi:probable glutamine synthetase [Serendipita indica DSM 11827]|uniref:Probable glutamine synthetase n=1 Tax=Serendipita indica (strain DSM 11827) TaxID=1109443 RepID=G4TD58_SERID|nr:probable glutamine synthetase [Serendipita indica DSM 11827]